jgi:hypothetical protein
MMGYKAGYEGQDSMREKAAKMMGMVEKGSLKPKMSKSAVGAEKPRPYKEGGSVQKSPPYKGAGKSVGVSKGPNAEMSLASRDKAPMRGEPSKGPKATAKNTPPYKAGGAVKKKASGGCMKATSAVAPVKKASGGRVGGDVNGPGAPMAAGAMQQYPKKAGGAVKKMAAGGAGKIRKNEMTASGKPIAQKKKGYEY